MSTLVRFAPSPTGLLHVGNARTALINWLFSRRYGGRFLLRFDDTDTARSREAYVEATQRDLVWLGLSWDQMARQSERLDAYQRAFDRLRDAGRVYACYETPEELEYKRRRQLARGQPPIYDRHALSLSAAEQRALQAAGRVPHWRFLLAPGSADWEDLVRGPTCVEADRVSDPVVVRADGTFLYMLPSTVDDIDFAVSDIIRGEDHVVNTAVQMQMFEALGAPPPQFAHLPLLTDIQGQGLSKRLGSITLESLRAAGIEPMALNEFLARLGTGEPLQIRHSLDELVAEFDIRRYGRGTPKFDSAQLDHLNQRLLHESPYPSVAQGLAALGLVHASADFWEAVRPNIGRLAEAKHWHDVCFGTIAPVIQDAAFVAEAAALLPEEPWTQTTWEEWAGTLRRATGRKGRELFQPLRLALTGLPHGPELKALLPLIGRDKASRRLQGEAA
jgi:glutamyl-tRNA synthetase